MTDKQRRIVIVACLFPLPLAPGSVNTFADAAATTVAKHVNKMLEYGQRRSGQLFHPTSLACHYKTPRNIIIS